jgi:outer membrane protein assembly factor BamB
MKTNIKQPRSILVGNVLIVILIIMICLSQSSFFQVNDTNDRGEDIQDLRIINDENLDNPVVLNNEYSNLLSSLSVTGRGTSRNSAEGWEMFKKSVARTGVTSSSIPAEANVLWTNNSGLSFASPVAAYNRIYMASNSGYIDCYEETTGNLLWRTQLSERTKYSAISTPAINDEHLIAYCSGDGTVYRINAYTGELNWTFVLSGVNTTINASNIDHPILIYNDKVLFGAPDRYLYCLDELNGKLIWKYKTGLGLTYDYGISGGAAVYGDSVYIGANDGYLYALDLDGFIDNSNNGTWQLETDTSKKAGDVLWKFYTGDSISSTPVVTDNYVYITVGIPDSLLSNYYIYKIFSINRNSGFKVWDYKTGNHIISSPAVTGDKVIFGSLDGKIYCLGTGSNTSQWAPVSTTGEVWSSPVVSTAGANDKLIIGSTNGNLYCLYVHNGVSVWQKKLDSAIRSSPIIANDRVFVHTSSGKLYSLGQSDIKLPIVQSTVPVNDEADVPVSSIISIEFDEPVKASTISDRTIKLKTEALVEVPIDLSYDEITWTVTIRPKQYLNLSNKYTVTVDAKITDWTGNNLDGNRNNIPDGSPNDNYKFSFLTSSNHPPQLTKVEVTPTVGNLGTNFEFSVLYTDLDGDSPHVAPWNDILIYFDGTENSKPMERDTHLGIPKIWRDQDFSNGERYKVTKKFNSEGIHGFRIWCTDGIDWNETIISDQPIIPGSPVLKSIPDQYTKEDEEYVLKLSDYLSDPDTPLEELVIDVSSKYSHLNGTEIIFVYPNSFNYPSGKKSEIVNISVSDKEFLTTSQFTVWVEPVNDPPVIVPIPTHIVIEQSEDPLNFTDFIYDVDNDFLELVVGVNSSFANKSKSGYELNMLYPTGGVFDSIKINVSDGEHLVDGIVNIKVVSSEVSFVLREIPDITVIEDIEYSMDITDYVRIIKGSITNLKLNSSSEYVHIDNLIIVFLYSDEFTYSAKQTFEDVKLIVTDVLVEYEQSLTLRVNVTPINDAPVLLNGTVDPEFGNISTTFTFSVNYFDVDGSNNIKVEVVLDGKTYILKRGVGVKTEFPGIRYYYSMQINIGYHFYYFKCDDGSKTANNRFTTIESRFFVTGNLGAGFGPGTEFNQSGLKPGDRDSDGIPDSWEQLYGLDNTNPSDALADFDGDGYNNLLEFFGHDGLPEGNDSTNPIDRFDKPKKTSPRDTTGPAVNDLLFNTLLVVVFLLIIIIIYFRITGRGLFRSDEVSDELDSSTSRDITDSVDSDEDSEDSEIDIDSELETISEIDPDAEDSSSSDFPQDEIPVTEVDMTLDDQPFLESDADDTDSIEAALDDQESELKLESEPESTAIEKSKKSAATESKKMKKNSK